MDNRTVVLAVSLMHGVWTGYAIFHDVMTIIMQHLQNEATRARPKQIQARREEKETKKAGIEKLWILCVYCTKTLGHEEDEQGRHMEWRAAGDN